MNNANHQVAELQQLISSLEAELRSALRENQVLVGLNRNLLDRVLTPGQMMQLGELRGNKMRIRADGSKQVEPCFMQTSIFRFFHFSKILLVCFVCGVVTGHKRKITPIYQVLDSLCSQIHLFTSSMTSVPQPLKFMHPHYMKAVNERLTDKRHEELCSNVISVLEMTMGENRECLKYKLTGCALNIGEWGHKHVRDLSVELAGEWDELAIDGAQEMQEEMIAPVHEIVSNNMAQNAETEACDRLMKIALLNILEQYFIESAIHRVWFYLTNCIPYVADPENITPLHTALKLNKKFSQYLQALRLDMQLNDLPLVEDIFNNCPDLSVREQLALMLSRQRIFLELPFSLGRYDDPFVEIMTNSHLNNHTLNLASELDIMKAKTPQDVYRFHLENSRISFGASQVDSDRQNLAATFVNDSVKAVFGHDKLRITDDKKWLNRNEGRGMPSVTASLGLILLWDVDGGDTPIERYLYSGEDRIKTGAHLVCHISNCGIRNQCEPVSALLEDCVMPNNSNTMRIGAFIELGLSYAGYNRETVLSLLIPVLSNPKFNWEVIGITDDGFIRCGSCWLLQCNSHHSCYNASFDGTDWS
ncbi:hypothetical protein QAD02_015521 [Eretmocerus hayati]|uniref:Uncharacterized protein n=1 Tax=Eretmocerus hayati TaxID=131215 RepID=A0ACC2P811_9HYME|nr:hypothetical protein QAD02_015521 [Eretmocerus hayati]